MDKPGLIQIYTGNGKGKTTAGLGLALRAHSAGKNVAIIFFDKGGEHYSERALLSKMGIDWFSYGLNRIDSKTKLFRFGVLPEDIQQAEEGIVKARELLSLVIPIQQEEKTTMVANGVPYYNLLILDEINICVALGMLTEAAVERLLDIKPRTTEIVLTGRTEIPKTISKSSTPGKPWPNGMREQRWLSYFDRADLISEIKLHKHYFYKGIPAREGIDF